MYVLNVKNQYRENGKSTLLEITREICMCEREYAILVHSIHYIPFPLYIHVLIFRHKQQHTGKRAGKADTWLFNLGQ